MITLIIFILNAGMFYLINMQNPDQLMSLAFSQKNIHDPFVWITSVFIHASIGHIAMNMIFFLQIGFGVEKAVGFIRYLWLYALSAIGANIAIMLYIQNIDPNVVVVGASGAIFGIFAYAAVLTRDMARFLAEVIGYHAIVYMMDMPIAWYAHAGGMVIGLLLGLMGYGMNVKREETSTI